MKTIEQTALIACTAKQMYEVVNDVKNYPNFLPGCKSTTIHEQTETSMSATMVLSAGLIEQSLSTYNTMIPGTRIDLSFTKGPFKSLHGIWNFKSLGDSGCKVEFTMQYEFINKIIEITAGPLFNGIANQMVNTFIKEANERYAND